MGRVKLLGSIAAYSERRAEEAWALLDLIELQSAAEVRANALASWLGRPWRGRIWWVMEVWRSIRALRWVVDGHLGSLLVLTGAAT